MLGNMLGTSGAFGFLFLSAHYLGIERLSQYQLYTSWILVIIPTIFVIITLLKKDQL